MLILSIHDIIACLNWKVLPVLGNSSTMKKCFQTFVAHTHNLLNKSTQA